MACGNKYPSNSCTRYLYTTCVSSLQLFFFVFWWSFKNVFRCFCFGKCHGFFRQQHPHLDTHFFAYLLSTLSCWISRKGRSLCLPHGEGAKVFNGWRQDIHAFKTRWMWVTTEAASFINKWICWTYYDQLLGSGMFTCTYIYIYNLYIYILYFYTI